MRLPNASHYVERLRFRRKWRAKPAIPPPIMSDSSVASCLRLIAWAATQAPEDLSYQWYAVWVYLPRELRDGTDVALRQRVLAEAARRYGRPENPVVAIATLKRLLDDLSMEEAL